MTLPVGPMLDRRDGLDRREGSEWAAVWHWLVTNWLAVLAVIYAASIGIHNANGALPSQRYFEDRRTDSLTNYYARRSRDEQFVILQTQFADLKAEIIAEHIRTDSIIRVLRRTICRSNPEACP